MCLDTAAHHRYQVLAQAITRGCDVPVNDYLKATNRKKVVIRDIDPKAVSAADLYGFVNIATREWKVCACVCASVCAGGRPTGCA